jgi:hypothetical protein
MAIRPAAGRGFEFKDSLNHSPGAHEDYEDNEVALDTLGDRDCGLTHQCIRYFLNGFVCRGGIVGGGGIPRGSAIAPMPTLSSSYPTARAKASPPR